MTCKGKGARKFAPVTAPTCQPIDIAASVHSPNRYHPAGVVDLQIQVAQQCRGKASARRRINVGRVLLRSEAFTGHRIASGGFAPIVARKRPPVGGSAPALVGRCKSATHCRFLSLGTEKPPFRLKLERTLLPDLLRPWIGITRPNPAAVAARRRSGNCN